MTDRTSGRRAARIVCAALVALAAGPALADDVQSSGPVTLEVRTGVSGGLERLHIANLLAKSSAASRLNDDMISKDGVVPEPTPGYRVTNIVLVRATEGQDPDAVPASIAGLDRSPVPGLPGWWRVRTSSVGAAIETATQLRLSPDLSEAFVDIDRPKALRGPTDPNFSLQWHLQNGGHPGIDVGAAEAWDAGYTGQGILIGVIEGGWQTDHPDLAPNFHATASMPAVTATNHATSVAGLIAAENDNGLGGVGILYDARVSNLIYGTGVGNAAAFLWRNDIHHVKNNSWGPIDNGTLGQITLVEREAIEAATLGRGGLGTIMVWAAGNGSASNDRTDYDPYASSRFVICAGAIDDDDDKAYYSEPGSSLLVVAHSSGGPGPGDKQIYTTKGFSAYTSTFGGTSTAAPIVSGIVGMMLQVNPLLSWRDVQHILVQSARKCDPGSSSWTTNGAGRPVSYNYGFGAVRAMDAIETAAVWHPVAPLKSTFSNKRIVNAPIPDGSSSWTTRALTLHDNIVIEAVEVVLNVTTTYVGDLNVILTAPSGTQSILAVTRNDPTQNFAGTVFTSRRHWGERAAGTWTVKISDPVVEDTAFWHDVTLRAYGSCPSDVNRDGITDILDLLDFLDGFAPCVGVRAPCFGLGPAAADYNRDVSIDVIDLLDMLDDFAQGC